MPKGFSAETWKGLAHEAEKEIRSLRKKNKSLESEVSRLQREVEGAKALIGEMASEYQVLMEFYAADEPDKNILDDAEKVWKKFRLWEATLTAIPPIKEHEFYTGKDGAFTCNYCGKLKSDHAKSATTPAEGVKE